MKKGKSVKLNLYNPIKSVYGTVDSKNLKSVYINIQSWITPKYDTENWIRIVGNLNREIKHSVFNSINQNKPPAACRRCPTRSCPRPHLRRLRSRPLRRRRRWRASSLRWTLWRAGGAPHLHWDRAFPATSAPGLDVGCLWHGHSMASPERVAIVLRTGRTPLALKVPP